MKQRNNTIRHRLVRLILIAVFCSAAYGQSVQTKEDAHPVLNKEPTSEKRQPKEPIAEMQKPTSSEIAPSLKETLDWIRGKLITRTGFLVRNFANDFLLSDVFVDECFASYKDILITDGNITSKHNMFYLQDIDPLTLKVEKYLSGYSLAFKTANGKLAIRRDGANTDKLLIIFQDEEITNRFAKALSHAIKLCASKKEPF